MIKLPHDLYKNIEEEYYQWVLEKLDGGKGLIKIINRVSQQHAQYQIVQSEYDSFFRSLFINPFAQAARDKFKLLDDYYQYAESSGESNDPLLSERRSIPQVLKYNTVIEAKKNHQSLREFIVGASRVQVCPYCNRQFIDVFKRNNKKGYRAIAQLDHLYPKSKFQLYALSLYNFVPSCASCNQVKSSQQSFKMPFIENADEENRKPYFKLKIEDFNQLTGETLPKIDYAFSDEEKVNNADSFDHQAMYQNHHLLVQRLLRAKKLHNPLYIRQIKELFPTLDDKEIRELLFGFNGDLSELYEKPLSKLAHDVLDL